MFDRAQLEAFSAVVQHGSFERVATVLHVTRGAISQRIKALGDKLSTLLVVREKPIIATRKGEILLRHIRALKTLEDDTISAILPKGTDLSGYTQEQLDAIADEMNRRPRKTLDWASPLEVYGQWLAKLELPDASIQ